MTFLSVQENDHQTGLWKAAWRRLDDAWELLEQPTRLPARGDYRIRHLAAAEYLAGYAVECLLKVYLIQLTTTIHGQPAQRWREVTEARHTAELSPDLSGSRSHSLPRLVVAAQLEPDFDDDAEVKRAFNLISKWRVSLRYRALPYGPAEQYEVRVAATVSASQCLCDWLKQRIGFLS